MTQDYDCHFLFSSIINQLRDIRLITLYPVRSQKFSCCNKHRPYWAYGGVKKTVQIVRLIMFAEYLLLRGLASIF